MKSLVIAALLTALAAPVPAQDLQPGPNFGETAANAFGTGRSENIDLGDVDNDGDLDVLIANGGDGSAQANRIYINDGGLQGGTIGTFSDGTEARFAGVPDDTSRDGEFVDVDNDGDLDIYISNRGGSLTGEASRFYDNQGGLQGGTIGFFGEATNTRWRQLESVPAGDQILGGDQGPWLDWSCDCDFGDLDLDGDLDLFHSSYGPNITGTRDSRVFLNDGGAFDELFPWATGGDLQWHTLDIDLADFDGDFDIDVSVSSRDSQARFFTNTLSDNGELRWADTTLVSLMQGGVTTEGGNYEHEYGDLDADGDFDIWFKNLKGNEDKIARNDGTSGGSVVRFTLFDNLVDDPIVDENEIDFLDFDADNDLDTFVANFSGTNWLYRSTLSQVGAGSYEFRRTDVGGEPRELPASNNGGTSLDGEVGDLDNDGDEDLVVSNDGNQPNRLMLNIGGVPDPHAPTFAQVEAVADKPTGDDARVIAQVRDNSPYYIVGFYDVDLVYSVDGGPEQTVDMFSQSGQQFMGFIPGNAAGTIEYRVEATDWSGNTGVSTAQSFVQGGGDSPYADLGSGKAGTGGLVPVLAGTGPLTAGSAGSLELTNALPATTTTLVIGFTDLSAPFKGGTLVPTPNLLLAGLPVDGTGGSSLGFTWPAGVPAGTELFLQHWIADGGATFGLSASNGLQATAP